MLALVSGCRLFDGDSETDLRLNHARWLSMEIHDYDFHFQRSCFCGGDDLEPVRIEVRGGQIARVISDRTGEELTPTPYWHWPTVDSLFVWTERSFGYGYRLSIDYDPAFRYPSKVVGDIPRAVDDEFTNVASGLVRR